MIRFYAFKPLCQVFLMSLAGFAIAASVIFSLDIPTAYADGGGASTATATLLPTATLFPTIYLIPTNTPNPSEARPTTPTPAPTSANIQSVPVPTNLPTDQVESGGSFSLISLWPLACVIGVSAIAGFFWIRSRSKGIAD